MATTDARTPLGDRLPWMLRWHNGKRVDGLACLFPDCVKVLPRHASQPGSHRWYCAKHTRSAAERRTQLLNEIERIEHLLSTTPAYTHGVDRRGLISDLKYLRVALVAYPRPTISERTVPTAR